MNFLGRFYEHKLSYTEEEGERERERGREGDEGKKGQTEGGKEEDSQERDVQNINVGKNKKNFQGIVNEMWGKSS